MSSPVSHFRYDREIEDVWILYSRFLELVVEDRYDHAKLRIDAMAQIQATAVEQLSAITAAATNGHAPID